jgi:hypothetical protein
MWLLVAVLVTGLVLTVRWTPVEFESSLAAPAETPSVRSATARYARRVLIVLVAGVWTGLLVTGPAVRLAMRLLAITAGDRAQGRITEADEVVGSIDLGGTVGLVLFGGVLPGILSAALYLLLRRWLPSGWIAGPAFGLLHLVLAATRTDPLRADNPDFDLVGPAWLAVLVFGLAAVVHGTAVVAFANRASHLTLDAVGIRRWATVAVATPPLLLLVPGAFLLVPIGIGLALTVGATMLRLGTRTDGPAVVLAGRLALGALVVVALPGTLTSLGEILT